MVRQPLSFAVAVLLLCVSLVSSAPSDIAPRDQASECEHAVEKIMKKLMDILEELNVTGGLSEGTEETVRLCTDSVDPSNIGSCYSDLLSEVWKQLRKKANKINKDIEEIIKEIEKLPEKCGDDSN